ncbi:MAG TPA: hypothetical protein VGJ87_15200 [Roseiflexaceae bacterium]
MRQRWQDLVSLEQTRETLRMSPEEKPYYTPGFPLSLVLRHKVRIGSLDSPPTELVSAPEINPIVADTQELAWYTSAEKTGLVIVDTPCSQALIGFVTANGKSVQHLAADVTNPFCAITLTALDAEPIARSTRMLLTTGARVENTGQQWNETRTSVRIETRWQASPRPTSSSVPWRPTSCAWRVCAPRGRAWPTITSWRRPTRGPTSQRRCM